MELFKWKLAKRLTALHVSIFSAKKSFNDY